MKILIVKLSSLGDILQTFPVVEVLKAHFPTSQIDWVVEDKGRDLVERNPLISNTFSAAIKEWRSSPLTSFPKINDFLKKFRTTHYDFIFDFQGNCKSAFFTAFAKGGQKIGFGKNTVPEWPNLLVTHRRFDYPKGFNRREDYLYLVKEALCIDALPTQGFQLFLNEQEKEAVKPFIFQENTYVVAHGSMWESKKLPKESWVPLLKTLEGKILFAWGSPKEKEEAQWMHEQLKNSMLLPKLSLPQLQCVMHHSKAVLSADSLALHLAETAGVKTYSVFGPSSSHKFAPIGQKHQSFQGHCPYKMTFDSRCSKLRTCQDAPCTKNIPLDLLKADFQQFTK